MTRLQEELSGIMAHPTASTTDKLQEICELLDREKPHFNWTGFYFRNGDKEELLLGPYVGEATEHTNIPFGRGICGQVAVSGQTFVVPDVSQQGNYLSCSIATKAEIVVPIFKNGKNIGQIDIDSHQLNPFTEEDISLLEWLCQELSNIL